MTAMGMEAHAEPLSFTQHKLYEESDCTLEHFNPGTDPSARLRGMFF